MARIFLTIGSLLFVFFSQGQVKVVNDANAVARQVDRFDGVSVSGAIELFISQGSQNVAVSAADKADVDDIITEVKGGVLYIRFKNQKSWWSDQWNTSGRKFRAYVSAEQIKFVGSAGSGSIRIEGTLKMPELNFEVSGSGNIYGDINTESLEVRQSGSSNVKLTGSAGKAEFSCAGSGNIASPDLAIEVCDLRISGSGNAELTVNKELSASISGSGNVRYKGNGNLVNASTAGSGRIRKI